MKGNPVPPLEVNTQDIGRAPPAVRRVGLTILAVLLAGAAYLIAVRGDALIIDLSALGSRMWCF